jgi:hypothetical protein
MHPSAYQAARRISGTVFAYSTHRYASAESQRFVLSPKRRIDWMCRSPEDVRTRLRRAEVAPRQRGLLMDMHRGEHVPRCPVPGDHGAASSGTTAHRSVPVAALPTTVTARAHYSRSETAPLSAIGAVSGTPGHPRVCWASRRCSWTVDSGLPTERLKPLVREVVFDGSGGNEMVMEAVNRRGRTIELRVAVAPLPSGDDEPSGALLLMEPHDDGERSHSQH